MRDPAFAGQLQLIGVNQLAAVGAVRLMYGSALPRGTEVASLAMLRSWGYAAFESAAEVFFSSLLRDPAQLLPFELLCAACRFCPSHSQLIDELAVCVDPRTVSATRAPEGSTLEEETAFQRALQAAYFVLRASWLSQTRQMLVLVPPGKKNGGGSGIGAGESEGEVERALRQSGLACYVPVMLKCQVSNRSSFFFFFLTFLVLRFSRCRRLWHLTRLLWRA
jgi:hypothetical protein